MWVLNWHVYHAYGVYTTILGEVSRGGEDRCAYFFLDCVSDNCVYILVMEMI